MEQGAIVGRVVLAAKLIDEREVNYRVYLAEQMTLRHKFLDRDELGPAGFVGNLSGGPFGKEPPPPCHPAVRPYAVAGFKPRVSAAFCMSPMSSVIVMPEGHTFVQLPHCTQSNTPSNTDCASRSDWSLVSR